MFFSVPPKEDIILKQVLYDIAKTIVNNPDRVNIKATTEEGLGFTGIGEGMACHAVCLLEES